MVLPKEKAPAEWQGSDSTWGYLLKRCSWRVRRVKSKNVKPREWGVISRGRYRKETRSRRCWSEQRLLYLTVRSGWLFTRGCHIKAAWGRTGSSRRYFLEKLDFNKKRGSSWREDINSFKRKSILSFCRMKFKNCVEKWISFPGEWVVRRVQSQAEEGKRGKGKMECPME